MHLEPHGAWGLLAALAAIASPCAAQNTPADTATKPPQDTSAAGRTDTTAKARTDTMAKPRPDSAAKPRADSAAASKPPAPPADTALARACGEPGGVLLVVFRADATPRDRAAAAKSVGGRMVGPAGSGGDGLYYVQIPGAGVNAAADQLIRLEPVRSISAAGCPAR